MHEDENVPDFDRLLEFASMERVLEWAKEYQVKKLHLGESDEEINKWFENLIRLYGPQLVGHWMCPRLITTYEADHQAELPYHGKINPKSRCEDPSCPKWVLLSLPEEKYIFW